MTRNSNSQDIRRRIGARLRRLRKRRGWTQRQLADAVGRRLYTISNIERGRSSTRIETANRMALALGVTLKELFDFPGETPEAQAKRDLLERLVLQAERHDMETIVAMADQANILLRFVERRTGIA